MVGVSDRPRRFLLWEKHGEPLGPKFDVLGGACKNLQDIHSIDFFERVVPKKYRSYVKPHLKYFIISTFLFKIQI
jgi:hypothetical protein